MALLELLCREKAVVPNNEDVKETQEIALAKRQVRFLVLQIHRVSSLCYF